MGKWGWTRRASCPSCTSRDSFCSSGPMSPKLRLRSCAYSASELLSSRFTYTHPAPSPALRSPPASSRGASPLAAGRQRLHLGDISATSRRHLGGISATSRRHLAGMPGGRPSSSGSTSITPCLRGGSEEARGGLEEVRRSCPAGPDVEDGVEESLVRELLQSVKPAHLSVEACELLQPMSSSLLSRKLAPPPSAGASEGSSGAMRISATSRLSLAPSAEA